MIKPNKLTIFTLLIVFLCSSIGSVSGCVWCEKGLYSDIHVSNHADQGIGHTHSQVEPSIDVHTQVSIDGEIILLDQFYGESGDSCFDLSIDLKSILNERIKAIDHISDVITSSPHYDLSVFNYVHLISNNLNTNPEPCVSQLIRTIRTVVLLT